MWQNKVSFILAVSQNVGSEMLRLVAETLYLA